jgi:ankyrin repeat protein
MVASGSVVDAPVSATRCRSHMLVFPPLVFLLAAATFAAEPLGGAAEAASQSDEATSQSDEAEWKQRQAEQVSDQEGRSKVFLQLRDAAENGDASMIRFLLRGPSKHGSVGMQDSDGISALMLAADNGHSDAAGALLDGGADVDLRTRGGKTALMAAARRGQTNTTAALLTAGAGVDFMDRDGRTALMKAALGGILHVVCQHDVRTICI